MISHQIPAIEWSFSNALLFEQCPRALYFKHIIDQGSSDSVVGSTDSVELEYHGSPGAFVGDAVHQCIGSEMENWRQGKSVQLHRLLATADEALKDIINRSNALNRGFEADNRWFDRDVLHHSIQEHLKRFMQVIWPRYQPHLYLLHEETRSFRVSGHRVWVRPDLVTRDSDGTLVITDWKSSQNAGTECDLQLQVYALWAHLHLEPDVERIESRIIKTSDGNVRPVSVGDSVFEMVRERVRSDCTEWEDIQDAEDFEPRPEIQKCSSCPYISECDAGQKMVSGESGYNM